ncbi:hypothetical protein Acr_15g0000980 [Actinidia rufa]|uniref:Uncharacterized protein n=1 Tax=Actinidia rufa TaxID=165716 RepID=A0A7J0FS01_9ERIC|nr:hypothetical protein Acr_15g0000980 [Actinidia rufa]
MENGTCVMFDSALKITEVASRLPDGSPHVIVNDDQRKYLLNEEEHKWVKMTSLDDDCGRRLFILCVRERFWWMRSDCILFADEFYGGKLRDSSYDGFELGRWKYIEPLVFSLQHARVGSLDSYPGFVYIFWPPLRWFDPSSSSDEEM